jgi:hypothetical protein
MRFQQEGDFIHQQTELKFKEKSVKCYIWSIALCGAETWTLRKTDKNYLESFEMSCWGMMEIIWVDGVRYGVLLHTVNEERNILLTYSMEQSPS